MPPGLKPHFQRFISSTNPWKVPPFQENTADFGCRGWHQPDASSRSQQSWEKEQGCGAEPRHRNGAGRRQEQAGSYPGRNAALPWDSGHGGGGRAPRDPACSGWGQRYSNTCSLHSPCPNSTEESSFPGNPTQPFRLPQAHRDLGEGQ